MNNLFPVGSAMDQPGVVQNVNDKDIIVQALVQKVSKICKTDLTIIELSQCVQEMRSQFASMGASDHIAMQQLDKLYEIRITEILESVQRIRNKTALFADLLQALGNEKGSPRYFRVKAAQICTLFDSPDKIVILSSKVRKFCTRFRAAGLDTGSDKVLTKFFIDNINLVETFAQKSAYNREYENAQRYFSMLFQALEYEKGSNRYVHIQAQLLAVIVMKEDIPEAIKVLLELEQQTIPKVFCDWHQGIRAKLVQMVKDKLDANEQQYLAIQKTINEASSTIDATLSLESLKAKLTPDEYLEKLEPVEKELKKCEGRLEVCDKTYALYAAFCTQDKLNFTVKTHKDQVRELFTKWHTLNESAIELLTELQDEHDDEGKNQVLREWLSSQVESYNCAANELSSLHRWALSYLGTLYFSNGISQESLDATVQLVRNNALKLFTHFKAFPCDVQLSFGKHHIDMSLLVLATVSGRLEQDYCTAEKIRSMLTWSFGSLYNSLMRQNQDKLPGISLDELIRQNVVHIDNLELILNELLSAFQKNHYGFANLQVKDIVALFEIANYLLEMPVGIASLAINHKHDTHLEEQLDALLWLRLAQARRLTVPYAELEVLLPKLTHLQFLGWARLFNPERLVTVPQKHHMLFNALADAGAPHILDKTKFTEKDVRTIFTFLTRLYSTLVIASDKEKDRLHSKLILFCSQVISRLTDLEEVSRAPVLTTLECLDTSVFREDQTEHVRRWLEKVIYPKLVALNLHKGLYTNGCGNFNACKEVHTLVMPLSGENSQNDVEALPGYFPKLSRLSLRDGGLNPAHLKPLSLSWLSLANIDNCLDCTEFQCPKTLESLTLQNVEIDQGSLAWLGACDKLSDLIIHAKRGAMIGKVAESTRIHGHPTLKTVSVEVDDFEGDEELYKSLSMLIASHKSVTSISIKGRTQHSLLGYIFKCAPAITSLTVSMAENEDLPFYTHFRHLETLTLVGDIETKYAYIAEIFQGYKMSLTGRDTVTITLKDNT